MHAEIRNTFGTSADVNPAVPTSKGGKAAHQKRHTGSKRVGILDIRIARAVKIACFEVAGPCSTLEGLGSWGAPL